MKEEKKEEKKGIRKEIEDIKDMLEHPLKPKKKKKGYKLPSHIKSQAKKAWKKNKILVFSLGTNRVLDPKIGQMRDGMVYIGDKIHNCSTDFVFLYKGKIPAIVVPEWSLDPIGTKDYYDAAKEGKTTEAQTIIIRAIEAKENMLPKKIGGKAIIWILVAGAVVFYVLFGQGG